MSLHAKKKTAILIGAGSAIALLAFFLLRSEKQLSDAASASGQSKANAAETLAQNSITTRGNIAPGSSTQVSTTYPASTQRKVNLLAEILQSRNDNDARLDTEFRNLTSDDKRALQSRYKEIASEKRNELGTIIFLLGREITTSEDLDFFSDVIKEKPCLSLSDCSQDSKPVAGDESHHEAGVDVTLNYPQLVVLQSIQRLFESGSAIDTRMRESALHILHEAEGSDIPVIKNKASEIIERFVR